MDTDFKLGDTVMIRPDIKEYDQSVRHSGAICHDMYRYAGDTFVVSEIRQTAYDIIRNGIYAGMETSRVVIYNTYYWLDEWLIPVDNAVLSDDLFAEVF